MKILIIGGTRFIGPYVAESLYQKGHEITLFHRGETSYLFSFPVNVIHGDRTHLSSFEETFKVLSPDVVIDMIAYSEEDATQLIHVFRDLAKRLIIISSLDVYRAYDRFCNVEKSDYLPGPLTEASELRTHLYPYRTQATGPEDWKYNYDKILVEKVVLSCSDINSTVLRLPMVYGPHDYWRIYPYWKRMALDRKILLSEEKAQWQVSRAYVKNIAHGIVLAALDSRSGSRIYNISEDRSYSELEWIHFIEKVGGYSNEIIRMPSNELPLHLIEPLDWAQSLVIETDLIRKELNYKELYTQEEAMKESIDWLQSLVFDVENNEECSNLEAEEEAYIAYLNKHVLK